MTQGQSPTAQFRRRSRELLVLLNEVRGQLGPTLEPREVVRVLARLAGKLKVHFAMEENLYLRLRELPGGDAYDTAVELEERFGGVLGEFSAFHERWTAESIARDRETFRPRAEAMCERIRDRVESERELLYPIVDRLWAD